MPHSSLLTSSHGGRVPLTEALPASEAMLDPYEEDPEAAEEDALEDELAWKLNLRMTDLIAASL